jgi:hypothetical protein
MAIYIYLLFFLKKLENHCERKCYVMFFKNKKTKKTITLVKLNKNYVYSFITIISLFILKKNKN